MANPAVVIGGVPRNVNVPALVTQVIGALQQSQTLPPPATMPRNLLATAQILGQDPGLRRPLGSAGSSVFTAWGQAAADPAAERYTIRQGNGQMASVGTVVRVPPAIEVTDGFGRPVPGLNVTFTATAGGNVANAAVATGQDGVASPGAWTLGPAPGLNSLQVRVRGAVRIVFEFTALAVPTRRSEILRGDGQQAEVGTALPVEPAVRVVDADSGQPVAGVNVAFVVTAGGGNVPNAALTDQDGIASAGIWTLGTAGRNTLEARVAGATVVTFNAVAIVI